MIPILILAAGQSSRMQGRDKLMEPVASEPQISRLVRFAVQAGLAPHVALPAPDHPRSRALARLMDQGLPVMPLYLAGSSEGMGGTLRDGVAALPPCPRFLITAADLPGLTAADLTKIGTADPGDALIVIATSAAGALGHPIAFDASLRPAFAALAGDVGARAIVRANGARIRTVALPGDHATRDLDTPDDWSAWRAETGA
jgi:molybdenum cofactor cytidylyltransferase